VGGGAQSARQCINERQYKFFFHFPIIHIKTGKVNNCQGNGITLNSTKTQIKSGQALLERRNII
jgi:hypothetical protein